ncbi:MAG: dihydrofolate reductase [Clostridiales Family XIII bacterium]|nr:dihydrofolate reductase [Clostridiales Family XIII bacterium]
MKAIVVVDEKWGIGKAGRLLVHIPGDLKYFHEKTLGKVVVMGRTTLESLPGARPLSDRITVVLTRNPAFQAAFQSTASHGDCNVVSSVEECLEYLKGVKEDDIYICGGDDVYRQFLPYCDECLVTKIEGDFGADRFFEDLDANDEFTICSEGEPIIENGISYRFMRYVRIR